MINSSQKKQENDIGKCVFDFNVLQVISNDKHSSLLKVRSKKNNQIYAMKKSNLEKAEKEGLLKYLQNEGEILQKLTHENICKFYKEFNEGNFQYIIMEFVEGENLLNFLNANKLIGPKIKEDKLMKIFLGCMNGLQYIHSKNIIHRNIKPINIIMDDDSNIKIIDFKYSLINNNPNCKNTIIGGGNFLAPELSGKSENIDYDNKIDVYSMGITFCSLAYFRTSLPERREENISEELHKIISNMLERDSKKRPSSSEVYNDLKSLYIKKNNDKLISSISSGIRGLASFPNFYDELNSQNSNNSMPMTKQLLNCIKLLNEFTSSKNDKGKEKKWNICLYDFKEFLIKSMKYNEEIEPIHIICFILRTLHKELSVSNNNKNIENLSKKANKEEVYQTFVNYYSERFKSFISDRFFGTIKTKSICQNCRSADYFFHYLYLIPFNVKILSEKLSAEKKEGLNIYDAFDYLNRYFIEFKENKSFSCEKCQKCTERREFKQFYNLSNNLILFFDRGEKCKYKNFVNFDDKLNIKGNNVEKFQNNKNGFTYDLYCIISRIEVSDKNYKKKKKEKYIIYTKDSNENKYINNNDGESYDFKEIKTYGDIIALFYYCKENIDTNDKNGIDNDNPKEINPYMNNSMNNESDSFNFNCNIINMNNNNNVNNNNFNMNMGNNMNMNINMNNNSNNSMNNINNINNNASNINMNYDMNINNNYLGNTNYNLGNMYQENMNNMNSNNNMNNNNNMNYMNDMNNNNNIDSQTKLINYQENQLMQILSEGDSQIFNINSNTMNNINMNNINMNNMNNMNLNNMYMNNMNNMNNMNMNINSNSMNNMNMNNNYMNNMNNNMSSMNMNNGNYRNYN